MEVDSIKGVIYMKIAEKTDYSYLFNNLNNNADNTSITGLNLSDYESIKNGSYTKLLKAYYAKNSESTDLKNTNKITDKVSEAVKEYTNISSDAVALQDSAEKLITRGSNSLFKETESNITNEDGSVSEKKEYDVSKIFSGINDFISKYNKFVKDAQNSSSANIVRMTKNLSSMVSSYSRSLSTIGITVNENNTLSIDEAKFKKSDMSTVRNLFNSNQSFAYAVSTKSSLVGTTADSEKNKAKNYTSSGNYSQSYSTGNILNNII